MNEGIDKTKQKETRLRDVKYFIYLSLIFLFSLSYWCLDDWQKDKEMEWLLIEYFNGDEPFGVQYMEHEGIPMQVGDVLYPVRQVRSTEGAYLVVFQDESLETIIGVYAVNSTTGSGWKSETDLPYRPQVGQAIALLEGKLGNPVEWTSGERLITDTGVYTVLSNKAQITGFVSEDGVMIEPPIQYVFTNQELASLKQKKKKYGTMDRITSIVGTRNQIIVTFLTEKGEFSMSNQHIVGLTPMIRPTELESGKLKY
jgi:hypothetical protein